MPTTTMTATEIGTALIEYCKQGKNFDAMQALYADDIVSIEAGAAPGMPQEISGKEAVIGKSQWWVDNHEVHDAVILGPWPNGDDFAVYFKYDVTFKPTGKRFPMEEAALYTVRDGKIVREKFYYRTDG